MRHDFAIEALGRSRLFAPHRYRYFCVRCRWMFLVEGRGVTALDEKGGAIPQPHNSERVATFSGGPCPAAPDVARHTSTAAEPEPPQVAGGAAAGVRLSPRMQAGRGVRQSRR